MNLFLCAYRYGIENIVECCLVVALNCMLATG